MKLETCIAVIFILQPSCITPMPIQSSKTTEKQRGFDKRSTLYWCLDDKYHLAGHSHSTSTLPSAYLHRRVYLFTFLPTLNIVLVMLRMPLFFRCFRRFQKFYIFKKRMHKKYNPNIEVPGDTFFNPNPTQRSGAGR